MEGYVIGLTGRGLPSGYGFVGSGNPFSTTFGNWASVKLIQGVLAEKNRSESVALVCRNSSLAAHPEDDVEQEGVVFCARRVSAITADVLPLIVVQTREVDGLKNWLVVHSSFGLAAQGVYSADIQVVSLPRVSLDTLDEEGKPRSPIKETERKVAQVFSEAVQKGPFGPLGQFTLTFRRSSFFAQYTEVDRITTSPNHRGPDDPCSVCPVVITACLSRVDGGAEAFGSKFLGNGYKLIPIEGGDTRESLMERIKTGHQQHVIRQGDLEALGVALEVADREIPVPGPWNALRPLRYLYDRAFAVRV